MVSTPLKNISQIANLPHIGVKIQNIWKHHLDYAQSPHFSMIHHGIYTTKALEEVPEASLAGFPDKGNNGPPRRFLGFQFRMGNQTFCKVCFFLKHWDKTLNTLIPKHCKWDKNMPSMANCLLCFLFVFWGWTLWTPKDFHQPNNCK